MVFHLRQWTIQWASWPNHAVPWGWLRTGLWFFYYLIKSQWSRTWLTATGSAGRSTCWISENGGGSSCWLDFPTLRTLKGTKTFNHFTSRRTGNHRRRIMSQGRGRPTWLACHQKTEPFPQHKECIINDEGSFTRPRFQANWFYELSHKLEKYDTPGCLVPLSIPGRQNGAVNSFLLYCTYILCKYIYIKGRI